MGKLYDYFENIYEKNKVSHAFLIGNTDFSLIEKEIYDILSDFFFHKKINDNSIDIYKFDLSDKNLKIEELREMIVNLSTTSQFNNMKVYIINQCEDMSDRVYNALLKTLEEPGKNIYAFLITKNMDQVMPTIVSRCQKIFIASSDDNDIFDDQVVAVGNELIKNIEEKEKITIAENKIYYDIESRELFYEVLKYIQQKYYQAIVNNDQDDIILLIQKNNDTIKIANKIIIISNNQNYLKSNLNKNLSIDRFLIEMWRCDNENSWN